MNYKDEMAAKLMAKPAPKIKRRPLIHAVPPKRPGKPVKTPVWERPSAPPRYVYFMADGAGRVKIGLANDPLNRCAFLMRKHNALPVACVRGDWRTEKRLHLEFLDLHIEGEWFQRSPDLEEFINDLRFCELGPCPIYSFEDAAKLASV